MASQASSSSLSQDPSGHGHSASSSTSQQRERFGNCALIEIIHLHNCLRGALRVLQADVNELASSCGCSSSSSHAWACVEELEKRVGGRFQVIWSVFSAHSAAEDEFIWPALREKQQRAWEQREQQQRNDGQRRISFDEREDEDDKDQQHHQRLPLPAAAQATMSGPSVIEQEEYVEDHADEERMFRNVNTLLAQLRECVARSVSLHRGGSARSLPQTSPDTVASTSTELPGIAESVRDATAALVHHLVAHLAKEEEQCMPLIARFLTKTEIRDLVGKIMGKRSSELVSQILTMAVQNLSSQDREDMVTYMRQAMVGTYFENWLAMGGWTSIDGALNQAVGLAPATQPTPTGSAELPSSSSLSTRARQEDDAPPMETGEADHSGAHNMLSRETVAAARQVAIMSLSNSDVATTGAVAGGTSPSRTAQSSPTVHLRDLTLGSSGNCRPRQGEGSLGDMSADEAEEQITLFAADGSRISTLYFSKGCCHYVDHSALSDRQEQPLEASEETLRQVACQEEVERLTRIVVTNANLTPEQKNSTAQQLRDSIWHYDRRHKNKRARTGLSDTDTRQAGATSSQEANAMMMDPDASILVCPPAATATRPPRNTPPSLYYKPDVHDGNKIKLVWRSTFVPQTLGAEHQPLPPPDASTPLFSASELAPTFHDGAASAQVLGCPHYARSCKLRHPVSGRLYTCRLCCDQERDQPTKDQDVPLDRYSVREVLCMRCGALQPATDRCVNPDCGDKKGALSLNTCSLMETSTRAPSTPPADDQSSTVEKKSPVSENDSKSNTFARYFCHICHLYDDDPSKHIYHCPYCNVCRKGRGLGTDYRHCMTCNACVSLQDAHRCISQKLEDKCSICHELMFQSTEPLRGLKCGHVMHLSCFQKYTRGTSYTCPLCKKSVDDMSERFALMDMAIRMQPMPRAFWNTVSQIYCHDCEARSDNVPYHFFGLKCPSCGSYNTREYERQWLPPNV